MECCWNNDLEHACDGINKSLKPRRDDISGMPHLVFLLHREPAKKPDPDGVEQEIE